MRYFAATFLTAIGLFGAEAPFHWTGSIPAGQTLEIKGVNGSIRAERSTGGQIEVNATRSGNRNDPNEVRIDVIPHGGGVTICSVYPGENNSCGPGNSGKMNVRNNDVKVEFTVRIPAGVQFEGRTVNGSVIAKDIQGEVRANTVNGDVKVSADGVATGKTVNGDVEVTMARTPTGALNFSTVNGTVNVIIPGSVNANFSASTVNGTISLDHPISIQGTVTNRKINGTMGGGGPELKMSTVNGDVRLLKSGSTI